MADSKLKGSSTPSFARGGKGHMFGKDSAGTQKSGVSSQEGKGGGKFPKGGSGHMFGKQSSKAQKPGRSGNS